MIFWRYNNETISYKQFLNDINLRLKEDTPYGYFVDLISSMVGDVKFGTISELIEYLKINSESIDVNIQTSGTTGKPKEISQSLKNTVRGVKTIVEPHIWAFAYNHAHFAGLQVFFQAFLNQQEIVYIFDKEFKDIPDILNLHSATHISCTPTFMKMLLPYMYNINSLKAVSFGGERLSQRLVELVREILPDVKIRNIYASSEAGSVLVSDDEGFCIPNKYVNTIKISDNELCIHRSLLGKFGSTDEWYHTGDIVRYVSPSKFVFDSRKSEVINTAGYRVSPTKIENFISSIDGVQDVVVYSRENSVIGNIVVADVVCNGNKSFIENKIKNTDELLEYEKPLQIKFVDSLELTDTGKIKRL